MKKGKVIVLEGSCDGVGKSLQQNLLINHLKEDNKLVTTHHFPSYETAQGKLVEMYLKGLFGNIENLSPYFINSLYALDRAVTWKLNLEKTYKEGNILVLDRYTTSSLIYQSALIEDEKLKKQFVNYVMDYEYNKLGIVSPDCVFYLHVPFELSRKLLENREENDGVQKDIHETNIEFLRKVYENSLFIANYLGWIKIECTKDGKMKSPEEIHEEIYKKIQDIL